MLIIKDRFQEYIDNNFNKQLLVLINEILFYGIFVYYYYFGPIQNSEQNFSIVKYICIIFIIKYVFNYVTNITEYKDNKENKETQKDKDNKIQKKTYFQFNSKIAIFSILILFLSINQNIIITLSILFGYALLSSGAKYGYTVDNILTVFVVYFLYSLHVI
jgi:hypothetical protein